MGRPGFTIIELLVVVCILAGMLSISVPTLSSFRARLLLSTCARTLATELRKIQSQAILEHKTLIFEPAQFDLPRAISFKKSKTIIFSSSGQTPPGGSGSLDLGNHFGQSKKIIISSSGRIRIE